MNRDNYRQFLLFSMIGAVGTGGHFITLILLVEFVSLAAVWATTVGFVVGAVINYFLNYYLTFKSDKAHRDAMLKFFTVALLGAGTNMLIVFVGVDVMMLHYLLVQLVASFIVLMWNFSVNKLWTFADNG